MEYTFNLSKKDYIEFNKFHLTNQLKGLKIRTWNIISLIIFLICLLAVVFLEDKFIFSILGLISLVFFLLTIRFDFVINYIVKLTIKELMKKGKLPMSSEVTLSFEDDFIIEKSIFVESKVMYEMVENIFETENPVYIYINAVQAIILPKGVCNSESELEELISFIKSKLKKNNLVGEK